MLKTVFTILLSFPILVSVQSDSLMWLNTTITRTVGQEVSLAKPAKYLLADARYVLEGYTRDGMEAFHERLAEVCEGETDVRKAEITADYGNLFFNASFYVGSATQVLADLDFHVKGKNTTIGL